MYLARFGSAILAASAVFLPLVVTGPALIFGANYHEFNSGLADILMQLAMIAPAALVLAAGLVALLPFKLFRTAIAILIGIGAALYVQGQWLVWDYGKFDGTEIQWSSLAWRSFIDWPMWIGCLLLALWRRGWLFEHSTEALGVILLLDILPVGIQLAQRPPTLFAAKGESDHRDYFSFSKKQNVLMILLDEFQSQAFTKLINANPEAAAPFHDFTYYPDTISAFPTTYPSIPNILSGTALSSGQSISAYLKEISGRSLPAYLKERGFKANLATFHPLCKYWPSIDACQSSDQLVAGSQTAAAKRELAELIDLSIFRQVPHQIKRLIYNDHDWFLQNWGRRKGAPLQVASLELTDLFEQQAANAAEQPTFKFFHFLIPHAPYKFDGTCEAVKGKRGVRAAYLGNAQCGLRIAERLLARVKQLEVYDQSLIIILADHGSPVNMGLSSNQQGYPASARRAFPLLLIKAPFQKQDALKTSEMPATLSDLPATVASVLGFSHEFPGVSLTTNSSADQKRLRVYRSYKWKHSFWYQDSLPELAEFHVHGPAWNFAHWERMSAVKIK